MRFVFDVLSLANAVLAVVFIVVDENPSLSHGLMFRYDATGGTLFHFGSFISLLWIII
jgi:hypothetical protein